MTNQKYWLGFSLIPGIGTKRLLTLQQRFDGLDKAWGASESQLRQAGLEPSLVEPLMNYRQKLNLDEELARIHQMGASLVTMVDANYPQVLKTLESPPAVIYIRGKLLKDDERAIAMVGTRKATKMGKDAAYDIAYQLAKNGLTVISGLAQGIDAAAHEGALAAGGRTIAIMGCGIDIIYPRTHAKLAQRVTQNGALITEFSLGTKPVAKNFPRRNRILSGLALGVLVVEAPESSGALITASFAAEQGRDVFAVPGNIYNPMSTGSNRLIQDGAKLVMSPEDILSELDMAYQLHETRNRAEAIQPANDTEAHILKHLSADPIHIDDIVRISGLSITQVSSTLTILELKGLAQMVGHMQYSLINKR